MFSIKSLLATSATLSFIASSAASGSNVAVYWGSGPNQKRLSTFCDETDIDIIPIGFLELFPQQGNGFPKQNFGNACWGGSVYYGPGSDHAADQLYTRCPTVQEDIPYCQRKGKKIVLSLGGAARDYQLTGNKAGIDFADFLWGAYGPLTTAWKASNGIRPLDRGYSNTNTSTTIDIDGFDFDIEHTSGDQQHGYIACIHRLRTLFATSSKKKYLITGAPQCYLPEVNMGSTIAQAQFDILWIQFYNNPSCSARNFAENDIDINYNTWKSQLAGGASSGAQLYIGLPGAPSEGTGCEKSSYGEYISAQDADRLIKKYQSDSSFGGVMLWEATVALNNECNCKPYYSVIKDSLKGISPPPDLSACPVTSTTTSATSSTASSSVPVTSTFSSSSVTSSDILTSSSTSTSASLTSSTAISSTSASSSDTPTSSNTGASSASSTVLSSSAEISSDISTSSSLSSTTTVSSSTSASLSTSTSSVLPYSSSVISSSVGSLSSLTSSSTLSQTGQISSTVLTLPSLSSSETLTLSSSIPIITSSLETSRSSDVSSFATSSLSATSTSSLATPSSFSSLSSSSLGHSVSVTESSKFPTFTPPYGNITSKPTFTSSGASNPSTIITDDFPLTTSTVYTTKTGTITKCPATVTNCPVGSVTTETIALYTTICPVSEAINGAVPTLTPAISAQSEDQVGYTTSTIYTSKIYTVTACDPGVICAGIPGSVVTEAIPLYTTVCPITQGSNGGIPTSVPSLPASPASPDSPAEYTTSTIYATKFSTVTACAPGVICTGTPGSVLTEVIPLSATVVPLSQSFSTTYVTIKFASADSTQISTPLAPYPTASKSQSKNPYGSGTGTAYSYPLKPTGSSIPSVKVVGISPVAPSFSKTGGGIKAVAPTGTPVSPSVTPSLMSSNSASGLGASSVLVMILAVLVGVFMM